MTMTELSRKRGNDSKYLTSKMFNLSKKERDLLDKTPVFSEPTGYGVVDRGKTTIEPFTGQDFSYMPKVTIRDKPVITPMSQYESSTTYRTPEETLLHELGHVKAMSAQGMRSLSKLLGQGNLKNNGTQLNLSSIRHEIPAERFSNRIMKRGKEKPSFKDLSNLKTSKLYKLFEHRYE